MDRAAATLSGGEAQRIRLATQIGSSLVGVLYILDEPSIGLHQRDNEKLIGTLERLRDLGNTVLVVEHDEGTMRAADHLIDMGPGAGEHGGYVVAAGHRGRGRAGAGVGRPASSSPGTRRIEVPARRRRPSGYVGIEGATQHNLKDVDVKVPLGVVLLRDRASRARASRRSSTRSSTSRSRTGCTGRSSVRARTRRITGLDQLDKIIAVDQSPIGRTPRSNPATYIGLFDQIRDLFSKTPEARARGYKAGPLLLQRQGRPLRGLPRRRADQDRDALPAGRLRAVRAVPRQALQPRDARGALQGQEHRRGAGDADRGGADLLRAHPEDPPAHPDAARRRARLHAARASRRRRCRAARRSA